METITRYFAAANGFGGFRSYFNHIFNPLDYVRIYILKGGPGTGKSSLMKRIRDAFSSQGYSYEEVYCSSDPNSLDGIIIKSNDKKCAVLDGTAPHEMNPSFPGAIDEIVNLGMAWDTTMLAEKKQHIISLNQEKKMHYKSAYDFLSLTGKYKAMLNERVKEIYNSEFASKKIKSFNYQNKTCGRNEHIRLISSFGKDGYKTFTSTVPGSERTVFVSGIFGSAELFMKDLYNDIKMKEVDCILMPSPFSDNIIEAIYIFESKTLISTVHEAEMHIDTASMLDQKRLKNNEEIFAYYSSQIEDLLNNAACEFGKASKYHFALEATYTPAMNFKRINITCEKIISQINTFLS